MVNQSKYGTRKEQKVAQLLRNKGAKVERSSGSRGAADLKAQWPTGRKWHIQVKSSRRNKPASPSPKDLGRLKQSATKTKATPVIAKVTPQKIEFHSARNGRLLKLPKKHR